MSNPVAECRAILLAEKAYNEERGIWASVNRIIDRLLDRELELHRAYNEVHAKLGGHPQATRVFFDRLLSVASHWNPREAATMRNARKQLAAVNCEIAEQAARLADALRRRETLHNAHDFCSGTHYHVCEVIADAGKNNYLFESWVSEDLRQLRGRFDLKYWPRVADFMEVLARDAAEADIEVLEPLTEAATSSPRASRADFFRALFVAVDDAKQSCPSFLPAGFRLSDESYALLGNCALDLCADEGVDGAYVKRLRQRSRERAASSETHA